MRKIILNDDTISKIRKFIVDERHTVKDACNRFNLKYDTMRRILFENNIVPVKHRSKQQFKEISPEIESLVFNLYRYTDTHIQDIVKESKLENFIVQDIINRNFTQKFRDDRTHRLYSKSNSGKHNKMYMKTGKNHPNYKGLVDDGNGYLMIKKPDWYTGRAGSNYVFYHTVVMCQALRVTELPKGFVVHHIDGNKHNNNLNNLALMNMGGHTRCHHIINNLCKVQRLSEQE